MSDQLEDPINDAHLEFGRAVVKLAREHGADDLTLEFDLASSKRFFAKNSSYQKVKMNWREGRHGSKASLSFTATATANVVEDME